jgi:6-phosphogluconolactonase
MIAVYVSNADSRDISVLWLDAASGELKPIQTLPVGGEVMPMAVSPDRRHLHAALRSLPYTAASFRIDEATGALREAGRGPLPDSMASVATDRSGRWLLAASYGGHKISVSPIDEQGVAGAATQVLATGPNAHAVVMAPDNRHLFVPCLGSHDILRFAFDAGSGRLSPAGKVAMRAGAGPRHMVFHPNGRFAVLLNELDARVDVLAFDAEQGTLSLRHTSDSLPPGFAGKPWAADLHLTPDGRYLYTCERTSSTLACFRVDGDTGALSPQAHTPTEMQPRGFAIDPEGRFLVAVGQRSHAGTLYAIDGASGALTPLSKCPLGQNPNWVEIVPLP